jgi:hypothetical protein
MSVAHCVVLDVLGQHTLGRCNHHCLVVCERIECQLAVIRSKTTTIQADKCTSSVRSLLATWRRCWLTHLSPTPPNGKLALVNCIRQSLITTLPDRVRRRISDCKQAIAVRLHHSSALTSRHSSCGCRQYLYLIDRREQVQGQRFGSCLDQCQCIFDRVNRTHRQDRAKNLVAHQCRI